MIRLVILSVIVALVWVMLTGHTSIESALIGFVLGLTIVTLLERSRELGTRRTRVTGIPALLLYLVKLLREILSSDVMVARRIITNQPTEAAGMFELPVGGKSETIAALSAHAITSAPGTFVVDFGEETMLVHLIDLELRPEIEAQQKRRYELCERMLADE
jgi:multicomponent K+:H+ antiporter subunit E